MKNLLGAVTLAMSWINSQMLTFDQGYYGIYERVRIDEHIRTNWCRPDCNAEYLRVLHTYREVTGDDTGSFPAEKIYRWLARTQDKEKLSVWRGSFPFYLTDGYIRDRETGESLYQNDNGKVIISLCRIYEITKETRYLEMAEAAAEYWMKVQQPDGTFGILDGKNMEACRKGPCFVQWMVSALFLLYKLTGKLLYRGAAQKGLHYLVPLILPSGRCRTSYELIRMEDWRPASSETAIMLYTLCVAYEAGEDSHLLEKIERTGSFLLSLQEKSGGICNCEENSRGASAADSRELCDLVYTAGFALQAFVLSWRTLGDTKYREAAVRLAGFLTEIQCSGESLLWDGGWRGSYHMTDKRWEGQANQNNALDEGGMYSVYTGWCCTNICIGLLELEKALREDEDESDT